MIELSGKEIEQDYMKNIYCMLTKIPLLGTAGNPENRIKLS